MRDSAAILLCLLVAIEKLNRVLESQLFLGREILQLSKNKNHQITRIKPFLTLESKFHFRFAENGMHYYV